MATPTMMWVFILSHVIGLIVLGALLWQMDVSSDEEVEQALRAEEVK